MIKLKKNCAIILSMVLIFTCFIPSGSYAASLKSEKIQTVERTVDTLLADVEFIKQADVKVSEAEEGAFLIEISRTEVIDSDSSLGETKFRTDTINFIAFDDEEVQQIENRIDVLKTNANLTRGSAGGYNSDWFLGSSLYLYISVDAKTKSGGTGGLITYYCIDKVSCQTSVNSGTIITKKQLRIVAYGVSDGDYAVTKDTTINITSSSNPYSTTAPSSWGYVSEGLYMGAGLFVDAKRPSGTAKTYPINVKLFGNFPDLI